MVIMVWFNVKIPLFGKEGLGEIYLYKNPS